MDKDHFFQMHYLNHGVALKLFGMQKSMRKRRINGAISLNLFVDLEKISI